MEKKEFSELERFNFDVMAVNQAQAARKKAEEKAGSLEEQIKRKYGE